MSMKKKIGGAVLATALGASLIAGGSLALFTADAKNEGNTFATGGVSIEDTTQVTHQFSNLAPGDNGTFKVKIKNTDSLDAWVQVDGYEESGVLFDGDHPIEIADNTEVVELEPGQSHEFTFSYAFPREAGDSYQGKEGSLTINFEAVQVKNNNNGTGPNNWD